MKNGNALYARIAERLRQFWKGCDEEKVCDEDTDDEDVILGHKKCWTCVENKATHKVWRDALDEYEYTCDVCHKNEYPESYEDEDSEDEDEDKDKDKDKKDGNELSFLSLATGIINEAYRQQEEGRLLSQ